MVLFSFPVGFTLSSCFDYPLAMCKFQTYIYEKAVGEDLGNCHDGQICLAFRSLEKII
jgi:hypothetical protein